MADMEIKYSDDHLDVHVFQLLPMYIRMRVLKEGKVLFMSDPKSAYKTVIDNVRDFEYYKPKYEDYLRCTLHGQTKSAVKA